MAALEVPVGWATVSGTDVPSVRPPLLFVLCPDHSRISPQEINTIADGYFGKPPEKSHG
jgi:hypothetical protein